jgi:Secretion system C-terminal sorting domain
MKNNSVNPSPKPLLLILGILMVSSIFSLKAQTIMFDDFSYSDVNDPQLPIFNKWSIVTGTSGPPDGGVYNKSNIAFIVDPANSKNKLMTLKTTTNGTTKANTHSRIETSGYDYFEGTYAARIKLTDESFTSKDANIQTFFTIVASSLAGDGTKYSEMDIMEYMAADKWGIAPDQRVGYTTTYHKYIANPWQAWKTYNFQQKSLAGWHTFVATCTDKVNVRYYMDNVLIATHSVTDATTQAGLKVYPRSNMQIAFANWIWNNVLGTSTANRTNTLTVDWVLYYKNTNYSPTQVDALVNTYRTQGLKRRNLLGQTFINTTGARIEATSDENSSSDSNALNGYPNPFKESLDVDFESKIEGIAQVKLIDMMGKTAHTQQHQSQIGTNTVKINGVGKLNQGLYIVEIQSDREILRVKVLKE